MDKCEYCRRPGRLVVQDYYPGHDWIFRFYLCRYHLASHNRRLKREGKTYRYTYIDFVPDDILIGHKGIEDD